MPSGPQVREADLRDADERALFAPRADAFAVPAVGEPSEAAAAPAQRVSPPPVVQQKRFDAALRVARSIRPAVALEYDRGTGFLLIPVAMAAGVFCYLALPVEPSLWALVVLAAGLAAAVVAASNYAATAACLALAAALAAGAGFARLETQLASTKMVGSEISTRLTGRVVETDFLANGRVRLTLDVIATERPKLRFAPDRVRVSARSVPKGVAAGMIATGAARLFPPSGPLRPDSYDFAYESYFDGIGGNGFFFQPPTLVEPTQTASFAERWSHAVDNLRNSVAQHIKRIIGPAAEAEIVAALIVGTRAGIPEDVNEHLRRTGLAHILSISGLHMALVAVSVMGAMRLGFAAFPGFASRRAVKKAAALVALLAIAAYLFISGAEVAARRSFIMLAVMLIAVMFDRAALTMRNLAIAAIITLAVSPHEVVGPSFQMSFAATAALIGGFQIWSEYRRARPRSRQQVFGGLAWDVMARGVRLIAIVAATSLLAGLATTIFGVWHFQRVSPLSLLANVVVSPIITLAMWTGVLAAAASPFGLDAPLFALMGKLVAAMLSISSWLSERSPVDAVGAIPASSVVLFTLALVVAALATTWLRWLAALPLAVGLMLIAGRTTPDMLIAEDGRLVSLVTSGDLLVNRSRPNGFTVSDWQRATASAQIIEPQQGVSSDGNAGFVCNDGVCLASKNGIAIAHTERASQAMALCATVRLIVTADATAPPCPPGGAFLVSARELARKGSATVAFSTGGEIKVTHAIREAYRPWHEPRKFSRAARGQLPFVPRSRNTDAAKPQ
jgi:ComEC/Rec2-related protein